VIDDDALLEYFQRGLIPGPEESEEAFLKRASQAEPLSHSEWSGLPSLFGFAIDWVPISYSNHKIAWWEGAATWISEDQLPSIQLRTNFQKGSFLGYSRSEVLSHEAIHAARMRFEEPQFEEVLAYATAPQPWKRFFGPLFSRTWEPFVLMLAVLLGAWWPVVPVLMIGLSLGWLIYRQWIFKRCCRKLSLPAVLCLTDVEMRKLAWMSDDQIQAYLGKKSTLLIRLRRLFSNRNRNRKGGGRL
jgi:hypothetical protein